jgi:preprotein translocase subunit SecE
LLPRPNLRPDLSQQGRGIGQFLSEVRSELRKVVWPTREEGAKLTALVVAISVAIGVLLGAIDFAFAEFFRVLLQR